MANANMHAAKSAKNDEFYTQFADIEREILSYWEYNKDVFRGKTVLCPCDDPEWSNFTRFFLVNFERFGMKKFISTSYAPAIKQAHMSPAGVPMADGRIPLFDLPPSNPNELNDPKFDLDKSLNRGRVLYYEGYGNGEADLGDIEWEYLEGDGDFRSAEVKKLRDEADFVITNPPFSLFREFVDWLIEGDVQYSLVGNKNAITYKNVFLLIRQNKMWLGNGFQNGNAFFRSAGDAGQYAAGVFDVDTGLVKFRNCAWFTNIDHGKRHEPIDLITERESLWLGNKKLENGYQKYDNYDAIEVPETRPSDYAGVMGVPITFLDKYCPEQFEILGSRRWSKTPYLLSHYRGSTVPPENDKKTTIQGRETYDRIFIRHLNPTPKED